VEDYLKTLNAQGTHTVLITIYKSCDISGYTHDKDVFLGKDRTCVTTDMTATHTALKQLTGKVEGLGCKLYMDDIFNVVRQSDLTEWECHGALHASCLLLVSCLTYPSTLKMEAIKVK
jgi:hypothetical protein